MKMEKIVLLVGGFLLVDKYYDGKYSRMFKAGYNHKYYQMGVIAFLVMSFYLFLKKNPYEGQNIISHANNMIKYMPIEKNTQDVLTPIFDFTSSGHSLFAKSQPNYSNHNHTNNHSYNRMMQSGIQGGGGSGTTKRSVSETKKKYVAANQSWSCKDCNQQLEATFEVNHIVPLEDGGSNHINNLEALCRNCHGKKTMIRNL